MVVTGVWVIFMELVVFMPQSTMIRTVLPPAVETVFMSAGVLFGLIFVIIAVLDVSAGVRILFVVIVVCQRWRDRHGQRQSAGD